MMKSVPPPRRPQFVPHDAGPQAGIPLDPGVRGPQRRRGLERRSQRAVFVEPHRRARAHWNACYVDLPGHAFEHVAIARGGDHLTGVPRPFWVDPDRGQHPGRVDAVACRGHHLAREERRDVSHARYFTARVLSAESRVGCALLSPVAPCPGEVALTFARGGADSVPAWSLPPASRTRPLPDGARPPPRRFQRVWHRGMINAGKNARYRVRHCAIGDTREHGRLVLDRERGSRLRKHEIPSIPRYS
ncbi:hypothetical protein PAA8504_02433 [Palleronia abyssalis]|uniref:Uncharacterized protein n=1 Tax=Palleronia abyssalis TaxID=1501240 RepID=A0A2R8BWQ1_9RHOB|nr:hypothetical protein PAA8504_02433 [Palleronia abyssalis]